MHSTSQPVRSLVLLLLLALTIAACQAAPDPAIEEVVTEEASPEVVLEESPEAAPEASPETSPEASPEASPETSPEASPESSPEASPQASPAAGETEDLAGAELVVYSGRNQELIGPVVEQFEEETGIDVAVRYGDTAEMAATILEEGQNSPADVYLAQDAGALGALTEEGRLQPLNESVLERVDPRFRDPEGRWVGVSGRARVVAYNTETLSEEELPDSIMGFTDPEWEGRIGWAPTNGSFQAFVTALRVVEGEEVAREWLQGIQANNPNVYQNNVAVLEAVASGEVDVGFVNHYYLFRKLAEQGESFPARNYFFTEGDVGGLVNVAGVGIVDTAEHVEAAEAFIDYLLQSEAQEYFSEETKEYPLIEGVEADPMLPSLEELETPEVDLNQLYDLQGTLELLQELGIL